MIIGSSYSVLFRPDFVRGGSDDCTYAAIRDKQGEAV